MKKVHLLLIVFCMLFATSCNSGKKTTKLSKSEIEELVSEAYVHCFPIVENYKAMYAYGINQNSSKFSPMNSLTLTERLYTSEDTDIVSVNNDTYYAIGMLDLRVEPVIIKVPEAKGRYYVFQLVDMLTNNFGYIGTNSTGDQAGVYAITAPGFEGKLPEGVIQIKSPSAFIIAFGRTGVNGEDLKDQELARKMQAQYQVGGLSKFYPDYKPKAIDNNLNFPSYTNETITSLDFFSTLNFLLPFIKLTANEQAIIDKYNQIGIKAGEAYRFVQDNPEYKEAVMAGMKKGLEKIDSLTRTLGKIHNGWICLPTMHFFGEAYDIRSAVARVGIYANDPQEAQYPMTHVDAKGQLLNGSNEYTITFPSGQLPPVKFFWSITLYDSKTQLFARNSFNRYSIGDRTKGLKYNKDNSLTIFISNKVPKEGTSNWLPAPEGNFNLIMRLYGPKESALNENWIPMPVIKTDK